VTPELCIALRGEARESSRVECKIITKALTDFIGFGFVQNLESKAFESCYASGIEPDQRFECDTRSTHSSRMKSIA
jgi:hypothetical protein